MLHRALIPSAQLGVTQAAAWCKILAIDGVSMEMATRVSGDGGVLTEALCRQERHHRSRVAASVDIVVNASEVASKVASISKVFGVLCTAPRERQCLFSERKAIDFFRVDIVGAFMVRQ